MRSYLPILVFFLGSLALLWISRRSLVTPRSHGFWRFFAWETILALGILNIPHWFKEPFSAHQLISWLLLCVSAWLVIDGIARLRRMGMQDANRVDTPMLEFEKTTSLVTTGVYRYIRHPLYSSLLFLAWGVFFKQPDVVDLILAVAASAFLVITARIEEAENIRYFGEQYRTYMTRTKMFIPFVY